MPGLQPFNHRGAASSRRRFDEWPRARRGVPAEARARSVLDANLSGRLRNAAEKIRLSYQSLVNGATGRQDAASEFISCDTAVD